VITGKTQLYGVIGYPIAHSLSPVMHNAALAHLGLDAVYLPFAIAPADLSTALQGFAAIGVRGFNVTIPHKQAILPLLTEVSELAQQVGAVNTVWRTETGWSGTNTDVTGFLAPLQQSAIDWSATIAVVLGNGGAARAVIAGLDQLGCAVIQVIGRDRQKLETFRQSWHGLTSDLQVYLWEHLAVLLPQAGLIVNTTPIGMPPHSDQSPLTSSEFALLPSRCVVYDLIYSPSPTQFLQTAATQGTVAIDGLEMLIHQGAAALQIWLQQPAPIAVMRDGLQQYLGWV
jgi:shikimate dehydrogenase